MPAKDPAAYARDWRRRNSEKMKAYDKARHEAAKIADPEKVKAKNAERQRRYRERHPERVKAYWERPETKDRVKKYYARPEVKAARKEWVDKNREKRRKQWRRWARANQNTTNAYNYKRKYGITHEERDALLASQGGCCAICKITEPPGRGWHTDHDHATGEVRGILCHKCNTAIGLLQENVKTFHAAIDYLGKLTAP